MREIKFRQPIFNDDGSFRLWEYWGWIDGIWINPYYPAMPSYQYTGRKDRNLKEVYEGDTVKPRSKYDYPPYEVYWDERACQFRLCANKDRQFDKTHPMDWADEVLEPTNEAP